jgi:hypothetical protein
VVPVGRDAGAQPRALRLRHPPRVVPALDRGPRLRPRRRRSPRFRGHAGGRPLRRRLLLAALRARGGAGGVTALRVGVRRRIALARGMGGRGASRPRRALPPALRARPAPRRAPDPGRRIRGGDRRRGGARAHAAAGRTAGPRRAARGTTSAARSRPPPAMPRSSPGRGAIATASTATRSPPPAGPSSTSRAGTRPRR